MKKIKTIFNRNWDGDKTVNESFVEGVAPEILAGATATEKLDGTNVRITVRNHMVVRIEKRRNPDKIQKQKGVIDPWYVDASICAEDKWIMDSVANTDFSEIPDGEWSGEAVGKNIQGNSLKLNNNRIVFFSLGQAPIFENVPTSYIELKEWLPKQRSKYGNNCGIEGIVWHAKNGEMFKIKVKDFMGDNR